MRFPRPCARRWRPRSRRCRRSWASILERMPKADKKRRAQLSELNEDVAKHAVDEALDDLLASFSDVPAALDYVRAAGRDLIRNVAPLSQHRRGGERHRQAAAGYGPRRPLPPLHGQRDGLQRRGASGRGAGRRGAQSHARQSHRPGRAHRPDGHAGHRLPADQARRAAPRQRRLSAARRAQGAALAVCLGGAEARHQDAARSASSSRARPRASADLDADAGSRAHPPRRARGAVRRPRALLHARGRRPGLLAPLQGAGGLRRQHRPLDRERQRLRPADRLDRQGARAQALRCDRRRAPHRRGCAAGRRPREAVDRDRPHRRHRARGRLLVRPRPSAR